MACCFKFEGGDFYDRWITLEHCTYFKNIFALGYISEHLPPSPPLLSLFLSDLGKHLYEGERMRTVQEAVLGLKALVVCGKEELLWTDFIGAISQDFLERNTIMG